MPSAAVSSAGIEILGECQEIEDGLMRCVRAGDGKATNPMSVYWIDERGRLPATPEELRDYQRSLFGRDYYELPKSLQLSHYLLWVIDDPESNIAPIPEEQRQLLETDVSYARKLVLTKGGFKGYLDQLRTAFGDTHGPSIPVDTWEQQLETSGLSGVFEDKARARVIRDIENGLAGPYAIKSGALKKGEKVERKKKDVSVRLPFIQSVRLRNFGLHPKKDSIDLGAVNLISGANGSGKTNVLEAIEFAFCGANLRAPRVVGSGEPDADLLFQGAKKHQRFGNSNQARLDLDLEWFGGYSRRDSKLEHSFNRYVFFNADSAFALQYSDDQEQVEQSISRLALGEEANLVWGRLNEYDKALDQARTQHRNRHQSLLQSERSLSVLAKDLLKPIASVPELFANACKALVNLKHRDIPKIAAEVTIEFADSIVTLTEELQEAMSLVAWIPEATLAEIADRLAASIKDISEIESLLKAIKEKGNELDECEKAGKSARERIALLQRYKIFAQSEWGAVNKEIASLERQEIESAQLATLAKELGAATRLEGHAESLLLSVIRTVESKSARFKEAVRAKKSMIEGMQKRSTERLQLRSDIRALGKSLVELEHDIQSCPICASNFEIGVLRSRLEKAIDNSSEEEGLLIKHGKELRSMQNESKENDKLLADLRVLEKAAALMELAASKSTVKKILDALRQRDADAIGVGARLKALRETLRELTTKGLTETEYQTLVKKFGTVNQTGSDDARGIQRYFADQIKSANGELEGVIKRSKETERAQEDLERRLRELRKTYDSKDVESRDLLKYVREFVRRASQAQKLLTRIASETLKLKRDDKIKDFVLNALVAKDRSRELLTVQEQENKRKAELDKIQKQIETLKREHESLKTVIERVQAALDAIKSIKKHHSLDDLLNSFFSENLKRINVIFQMIHSPKDFEEILLHRGSGRKVAMQLKRVDGKVVEVTQISAGQRAALAMAIFFALNEKLLVGPQLVLLDEPVAHIDDLNALAFFDYLREVALSGKRQIAYATANEKMAQLFHRKFEFLGDRFKQIPLARAGGRAEATAT